MPTPERAQRWSSLRSHVASTDELRALDDICDRAQKAWPQLRIDDPVWLPFVARRMASEDGVDSLSRLRCEDLWLVCAVLGGDPVALRAFERAHRPHLALSLRRFTPATQTVDDIIQMAFAKLLVGDEGRPPTLSSYAGRGSLDAWLRLSAVRIALDLRRQGEGREVPVDDQLLAWPDPSVNPELDLLRRRYAGEFKAAFADAMGTLSPRARNVLRQQVLYQLTLEQMAAAHGVHRSAIARWLADARATLLSSTRGALAARIGARSAEVESLLDVLHGQLDLSIERLLSPDFEHAKS